MRYLVRQMTSGFTVYGIWDVEEDTWHDGEYANAVYAAGIPTWRRELDASSIAKALNAVPTRRRP